MQGPKQVRKKPDAARLPLLPVAPVYNAALWGGFQTQYLPPNGRTIDAFSWVINVNSLWPADISTVTKMASGALPLILVGQQRQDPRLVNNGLQAYGHSMKILSEALSKHQSKDQLVYNLLACIIMQSIEMMHTEAIYTSSWLAHLIGMMSLVLAIGPEAFQDRFHSIFLYCRMYIVCVTFRSCFWATLANIDTDCHRHVSRAAGLLSSRALGFCALRALREGRAHETF